MWRCSELVTSDWTQL